MKKSTTNEFIFKAKLAHGDKYDYTHTIYTTNKDKLIIICPIHGKFEQTPVNHIYNKQNCPKCSNQTLITHNKNQKLTSNDFIKKATLVHGNKYDYSLVEYVNKTHKILILCSKHGEFEQRPGNHLRGSGCPICNESKGERIINQFLIDNKFNFTKQHTFDECKNINKLPFDFYLPDYNICIEYDGEQHFKPIKVFGGIIRFKKQQITDKLKNEFCYVNTIKLIRIPYNKNVLKELKIKLAYII